MIYQVMYDLKEKISAPITLRVLQDQVVPHGFLEAEKDLYSHLVSLQPLGDQRMKFNHIKPF